MNTWMVSWHLIPGVIGSHTRGLSKGEAWSDMGFLQPFWWVSCNHPTAGISSVLLIPESQHTARCHLTVGALAFIEVKHKLEGKRFS